MTQLLYKENVTIVSNKKMQENNRNDIITAKQVVVDPLDLYLIV